VKNKQETGEALRSISNENLEKLKIEIRSRA
jgi:hypothetical protein